ncbi:MAG: S8 family serine peptidase [Lachnospiraceae bacterium]
MRKAKKNRILTFIFIGMVLWISMPFHLFAEELIEEPVMEENIIEIMQDSQESVEEIKSNQTEIKNLEQESSLVFDEEVSKLVSLYDNNLSNDKIASSIDNSYASRRLIVKGTGQNLDFSSCDADIILNGPDQIYILQFSTEEMTRQAKMQIEQMDGVKYCEVDGYDYLEEPKVIEKFDFEEDEISSEQPTLSWGTSHILGDSYAKHSKGNSSELIVAVVDTGIDISHSFFNGRLSMDAAYNYVSSNVDVQDDQGHGTHVSGIIADMTSGLNIKILPIKCMDAFGRGTYTNIANAIKRAADAGAKVINYSAVGGHSEYKDDAVNYAIEKGATVVVSSGNYGQAIDEAFVCPAHIEECIVVGAINEQEVRSQDSNYGNELDLMAPGISIKSTYLGGGYAFLSGTSMAAPHVSGAAAMLRLNDPLLTPAQIEEVLKQNAKDLGDTGRDIYYGYGMVDLSKFIVHNEVEEIVKATTSKNGIKKQVCEECGRVVKSENIYYPKKIALSTTEYIYTGRTRKPYFIVTDSNGKRISSSNYTMSYSAGRTNVGTYLATLKFTGKLYSGTINKSFKIVKAAQKITAGNIKKALGDRTFTLTGVKLEKGNGKLSYVSSNNKVATISSQGKVTIKGIGKTTITITAAETSNYKKATKKITITVIPAKMKINCLTSRTKKSFTACWNKNKTITAYQIQYSTKSNFSNAVTKTVCGYTYKTISSLQAGKKYYVRLRTYKTVGKEKYYSSWSDVKTVTTRRW